MSYNAVVTRIHVRKHPNADRLQLATCLGNQVVVGMDAYEGQLGIFFPTDGQLSPQMAEANDLIERVDPATGKRAGGFFGKNRRVRAQKFRGERSDGFWTPLLSFRFAFTSDAAYVYWAEQVKEGQELTAIGDVTLCNKYVTPATASAYRGGPRGHSETKMFKMHFETLMFRNNAEKIPQGALLIFTEKMHGTSHRVGRVMQSRPRKMGKLYELGFRLGKMLGARWTWPTEESWEVIHGTRRVVLTANSPSYYGNEFFRYNAIRDLEGNLHKGETLYGEIVGWVNTETPIMPPQSSADLKDKDFTARYGEKVYYTYGQEPGTAKFYVYRITMTNEDGDVTELSWSQVRRRCSELGVDHVMEIFPQMIYHGDVEVLRTVMEQQCGGPSCFQSGDGPWQHREGVCLRVEHPDAVGEAFIMKLKNFEFGVMEGYLKANDAVVDIEEAQSVDVSETAGSALEVSG